MLVARVETGDCTGAAGRDAGEVGSGSGNRSSSEVVGRHYLSEARTAGRPCHLVPELPRAEQKPLDRVSLSTIGERLSAADIAAFLGNPHSRYPDGRMPETPSVPSLSSGAKREPSRTRGGESKSRFVGFAGSGCSGGAERPIPVKGV